MSWSLVLVETPAVFPDFQTLLLIAYEWYESCSFCNPVILISMDYEFSMRVAFNSCATYVSLFNVSTLKLLSNWIDGQSMGDGEKQK